MKRVFLVIFLLFSFLFLVKKVAFAASCLEFTVDVNGSTATVNIDGCDTDGNYVVLITDANGNNLEPPVGDGVDVIQGRATKAFYLSEGNYKAILLFSTDPIKEKSFTIQTTTYLRCGDPCNPLDDRCSNACPCLSEAGGGGQWRCGASGATLAIPPTDIHGNCSQLEINTALGCIPADTLNNFVAWFLSKLIFIASGVAFLLMAFGALKIITSAGSPESIQAGKELITSSLAGLVFIILSLFLLKLIGVDILQIPGFGG